MGKSISIVVPFYNVKPYICRCLDSILAQTYKDIEIICVDDGSTDGSAELLDAYSEKDDRVVVIHKPNGGLVSARKAGKRVATGDYIMDVDGDDWIEPDRVEVLMKSIVECPADLIYMSGMYRDTGSTSTLSEFYFKEKLFFQGEQIETELIPLIADPNKSFGKMLIRNIYLWAVKSDIGRYCQDMVREDVSLGEDSVLVYYYLQNSGSVSIIPNPTYHYFQRNESMSHKEIEKDNIRSLASVMKTSNLKNELFRKLAYDLIYFNIVNTMSFLEDLEVIYPFSTVCLGETIAVYGCGGFGQRLVNRLCQKKNCIISCWVDKNVRQCSMTNIEVESVETLLKTTYDHVVIAIINEDIAKEVENNLIKIGIPEDKVARIDKVYMESREFHEYIK